MLLDCFTDNLKVVVLCGVGMAWKLEKDIRSERPGVVSRRLCKSG